MKLSNFETLYQSTVAEVDEMIGLGEEWRLWSYELSGRLKRVAGQTRYNQEKLVFSKMFIQYHDEADVKLVILHELAHVLTEGHHHDSVWKAMCKKIGGDGQRCYDARQNDYAQKTAKYEIICPNCGKVCGYRQKRAKSVSACKDCCLKYNNGIFTNKYILKYQLVGK